MSLFNDAVLILKPSGYKATKLYATKPTDGTGDATVARAGTAYRVDSNLAQESMGANVPRINYPLDGGCPYLLTEPASTNLFLNSAVGVTQNITVTAAQSYTIYFLSGAGTITLSDAATQVVSVSDLEYSNAYTFTAATTTLTCTVAGVANLVQVENLSYPTSYIVTTGATASRIADAITGAGDATLFSSVNSSGVLYAEIAALADDLSFRVVSLNDNTGNNNVYIGYINTTNTVRCRMTVGGVAKAVIEYQLADETIFHKIAIRYNSSGAEMYIDGVSRGTPSILDCSLPASTLANVSFNFEPLTLPFYGKTKQVAVYNYLTDAQMITLTT